MLGPLGKYIDKLVDSLVDPLWNRILALKWFGRAAVFVGLLVIAAITVYRERVLALGARVDYMARVQWTDAKIRPLTGTNQDRVNATIARLAAGLEPDIANMGKVGYAAWPIAQIAAALNGIAPIDSAHIAAFLQTEADSTCKCWQEIPGPQGTPSVPISGWIVYTLAELNRPITREELDFFLNNQQTGGWSPMFPGVQSPERASTYATAWTILALNEQAKRGLLDSADSARAQTAVKAGRAWLLNNRVVQSARWKDYPLATEGTESESLSGLALHALHHMGQTDVHALDEAWLANLPPPPRKVSASEQSNLWTNTPGAQHMDAIQQYRLPWLLMATADAYPAGTRAQKANALAWLDRVVRETDVLDADAVPDNWVRAETLLALRHLVTRE